MDGLKRIADWLLQRLISLNNVIAAALDGMEEATREQLAAFGFSHHAQTVSMMVLSLVLIGGSLWLLRGVVQVVAVLLLLLVAFDILLPALRQ